MSATVYARRVRALPQRASSAAWRVIADLLAPQRDRKTLDELAAVDGIASYLIGNEALKAAPLVVWGAGPRVRVYCIYGDDAVTGEDANESALPESPTEGNWRMSLPAPDEDLDWIRDSLNSKGVTRIGVRSLDEAPPDDDGGTRADAQDWRINEEVFRRL